jgi:hypothetical protein
MQVEELMRGGNVSAEFRSSHEASAVKSVAAPEEVEVDLDR